MSYRLGETAASAEVWNRLAFFESAANVRSTIVRLAGRTWNFDLTAVAAAYTAAGLPPPVPRALDVQDAGDLEVAVLKASVCVRHARELLHSASSEVPAVRPLELYYGCLSLTKAMIAVTLAPGPAKETHGMSFDTVTQIVTVQKIGELSSLHNSLSDRVEMFVPPDHPKARSEFRLDDLLRALPGTRERFAEVDGHDPRLLQGSTTVGVEVPRVDGSKVWVHVAAIELMIAHALSTWSRYDPVEWEGRLSGLRDGMSYIYLAFMDQVLVDFPLWTLRILTDQDYWFGPHPFDESNVNRLLGNLFTP